MKVYFFQAEDGIRDIGVTGVQTCALPIYNLPLVLAGRGGGRIASGQHLQYTPDTPLANLYVSMLDAFGTPVDQFADSTGKLTRSEERRVGKEGRSRWSPYH